MADISLECDGFKFNFKNVNDAYIFDEKDENSFHYHGGFMKSVDLIVENDKAIFFIELKDYKITDCNNPDFGKYRESKRSTQELISSLIYKFRDTYLYKFAEGMKFDKKVNYICLIEIEPALKSILNKRLNQDLPVGAKGKRWKKALADSCCVVNIESWNRNFLNWKVSCI